MAKNTNRKINNCWYLYIIRCNNNSLYTGITTDVERRFKEHLNDPQRGAKYLRGKAPLTLCFSHLVGNRSEASKLESKIKKLSKTKKEMLINRVINVSDI